MERPSHLLIADAGRFYVILLRKNSWMKVGEAHAQMGRLC